MASGQGWNGKYAHIACNNSMQQKNPVVLFAGFLFVRRVINVNARIIG